MNTPPLDIKSAGELPVERKEIRALFVEDSPDDVELAVLAMERDGFDVRMERVESEEELRSALAERPPHVILSDYSMPNFDGITALGVVRELTPDIPFIFVSGTLGEDRAIYSIQHGATDYVLKGNLRRLGTAVRRALDEAVERRHAKEIEEERRRLVTILESTSDFVGMTDPDGYLIYMNAGGRRLLELEGEVHGCSIVDFYGEEQRRILEDVARPTAECDAIWHGELEMRTRDGRQIPMSQVLIAHRGPDGQVQYFSTIARDIRERKLYEQRIQYLANYDALTDLPNRDLLADRMGQAINYARRTGHTLAVLILNIDQFKLVLDGYGHDVGDKLLNLIAGRLRDAAQDGDTVARLGADSFAVLAANLGRPGDAEAVVRKFQAAFQAPFTLENRDVHVTVSIGVSIFRRDGEEVQTLLQNANAAMHRAKSEGGGGKFQFYAAEMTEAAAERVELENELRSAVGSSDLLLYYQPQVALESGALVGVEALMRWKHRQRGWISPGAFIPIAEGSELIHVLGGWALESACNELKRWQQAGASNLCVAVNVSAHQFHSKGFIDSVAATISEYDINPEFLELELTESVVVEDQDQAIEILSRLKDLGLKVAVDDFGTGYSSLSYLSSLPIDCLKIDQSFVRRMDSDRHGATIVQAIISLGSALGLRVIAEGIETEAQLEFLRSHGCQDGQGYLWSKPVGVQKIGPMLGQPLPARPESQ